MTKQEYQDMINAYDIAAFHLAHLPKGKPFSFIVAAAKLSQRLYKCSNKLVERKKRDFPDADNPLLPK